LGIEVAAAALFPSANNGRESAGTEAATNSHVARLVQIAFLIESPGKEELLIAYYLGEIRVKGKSPGALLLAE
jgi:hypothetical protein